MSAQFGEFGPIEDVSVKFERRFAFVQFKFRASASFAKEAMNGQALWLLGAEPLSFPSRWANDDPNPIAIVRVRERDGGKGARHVFAKRKGTDDDARGEETNDGTRGRFRGGDDGDDDKKKDVEISFDPADYDEDEDEDEAARNPKP